MRVVLTDKLVASLKPSKDIYWDLLLPRFGVWRGAYRTSFLVYKDNKRTTVASYPQCSLADARSKARTILLSETSPLSLLELVNEYIERHVLPNTKPKSARETTRILRKHFALPMPLNNVSVRTITPHLEVLRDTPIMANQATVCIKAALNWAVSQQYLPQTPSFRSKSPSNQSRGSGSSLTARS